MANDIEILERHKEDVLDELFKILKRLTSLDETITEAKADVKKSELKIIPGGQDA